MGPATTIAPHVVLLNVYGCLHHSCLVYKCLQIHCILTHRHRTFRIVYMVACPAAVPVILDTLHVTQYLLLHVKHPRRGFFMQAFLDLPVTDQTIVNIANAPDTTYSVRDVRRWGAIVWRDKSAPGGLGREFLKERDKGRVILIHQVKDGDFIELAEKIVTHRDRGATHQHLYFQVIERLPDRLVVKPVEATAVPPKSDQKSLAPEQKSQIGIEEISKLRSELAASKIRTESLAKQIAAAKTICNRLRRKHKEGKLNIEVLGEELSTLDLTLKPRNEAETTAEPARETEGG